MKNNELIAEFMGLTIIKEHGKKYWSYDELFLQSDTLNFDTSWDWLIPVVERFIEKAKATDMPHALYMNVAAFTVDRPISELYEHLVKGIKWHNKHIKNI